MKRFRISALSPSAWLKVLAPLSLCLSACGGGGDSSTTIHVSASSYWELPALFPDEPLVPASNLMDADKVELGRFLFYDTRLSGNGSQSCASCHHQDKAFTDGRTTAIGSTGDSHPRNAQSLTNVAYNTTLTWANRALTELEVQMLVPLFGTNPVEMGVNDDNKAEVLARIASDAAYQSRFRAAFPDAPTAVSWDHIVKAISAFQRTLISGNSKYDRAEMGRATYTESEARGKALFFSEKAECFHCHSGFNFNDQVKHRSSRLFETPFHNTGLYNIGGTGAFPAPNRGIFEHTANESDMGKFRAPSLRNVAVTGPYMHDGTIATLEEVLAFYAAGGRNITEGPYAGDGRLSPHKNGVIANINLTEQDIADVVAFLRTLTDDEFLTNPRLSNPFEASHAR